MKMSQNTRLITLLVESKEKRWD